jgi:branched-subunit amino acid aminotransferase/4-amino-4-deoxychorismate lyase
MNISAVVVSGRGLVDVREPVFFADDEALLRGRAAFETLHVYEGRPFLLEEHVDRLRVSSQRLRLPEPDRDECAQLSALAIEAAGAGDLALRMYWTGVTLVATTGPVDPGLEALRARGLRLAVVRWSTGAVAGAKSMSYAANMAAQDDAIARGAEDALLVAHDDTVLEAPTANVWWREGTTLVTPSLQLPILAGVTRSVVVQLAPELGYSVEEGVFPLERLLGADEAFVSSSVREVMPVAAVDATAFAETTAAHALQQALRTRALATL